LGWREIESSAKRKTQGLCSAWQAAYFAPNVSDAERDADVTFAIGHERREIFALGTRSS